MLPRKTNIADFTLHAYIAEIENVLAAPVYPALLDTVNSLIIHPHPIDESLSPGVKSFGSITKTVSENLITISYAPSAQKNFGTGG